MNFLSSLRPYLLVLLTITAGYVMVLGGLAYVGLQVSSDIHLQARQTRKLYQHSFQVNKAAHEASEAALTIQNELLLDLVQHGAIKPATLSEKIAAPLKVLDNSFLILESAFMGDPSQLQRGRELLERWKKQQTELISLLSASHQTSATAFLANEVATSYEKLNAILASLAASSNQQAIAFANDARQQSLESIASFKWLLVGFVLFTLVAGGSTTLVVLRSLYKRDQKLRQEQAQIKQLANLGGALDEHAIVSMTDAAGNISYVNQKFIDISGYQLEELLGRNHRMLKSGVHPPELFQQMWDTLLEGKIWQGEVCNRRKSGALYWVRATIKPILDENELPISYISIRTDITDIKQTEENSRRNQILIRSVINSIPDLIYFKDKDGKYLGCNTAFERYFDSPEALIVDKTDFDFLDQETAAAARAQDTLMLKAGMPRRNQEWITYPDGRKAMVDVLKAPYDYGGSAPGVIGISHDITDDLVREQELRAARDKAESASKAKSEFVASMSHELRTPMNAILGFAQLMEGDPSCSEDQRENLQQISNAGWHLLDLINEVLDLARVESGQVQFKLEDVPPAMIIAQCLSLLSPLISSKHITIHNQISATAEALRVDYLRLKQVLINFLSNAIKYNHEGGQVTIGLQATDNGTSRISISDTGLGMTPEQLDRLFEPFTRFGDNDKVQGTGIGLSISKKLIEGMGGKVHVTSSYGEGSVFSIILPRAGNKPLTTAAVTPAISLLYIENNPTQKNLLEACAYHNGWHLDPVNDAALGIDLAMNGKYDAILLDMFLPGGFSGLEIKLILDEMESQRSIPVIGFYEIIQQAEVEKALQAGFSTILAAPADIPELELAIQEALRTPEREACKKK